MNDVPGTYMLETPLKTQTLSGLALERISDAIALGHLRPGERISEADLARRLGISRGPLREAISLLEGRRLLVREPRIGVRVAELSLDELKEIFVMREALEGMACRLAAQHMTDDEIQDLRTVLQKHHDDEAVRAGVAYFQNSGDVDFHCRIIKGSKNTRLIGTLLDELHYVIRIYRYRSSTMKGRTQQAVDEHEAIIKALENRDPDAAEAAMRRHIARARDNLTG